MFPGALSLVLLGSSGKTFDELAYVLGLSNGLNIQTNSQSIHEHIGELLRGLQDNSVLDTNVRVNFASAVFIQDGYPVRPIYKQTSENIYRSDITNIDFRNNPRGAQNIINNWVNTKTNSKISSILNRTPPTSTKVIICSALYFVGKWEKPFFEGLTKR